MDLATIVGLISAMAVLAAAIVYGGGFADLYTSFLDIPSVMIVFGGAGAALFVNFPMKNIVATVGIIKKCFLYPLPDPADVIRQFKELATVIRKDGMLALEQELTKINDDFMKRGLENVISGANEETLRSVLETELEAIEGRHLIGKQMLDSTGAAAPAFGMMGTVIGLVQMMKSLEDPSQIGKGMAVCLLTTFYGAILANVVCIPLGSKLDIRSKEEVQIRELMITGMVGLACGLAPRALEEHMAAYLSPKTRRALQTA